MIGEMVIGEARMDSERVPVHQAPMGVRLPAEESGDLLWVERRLEGYLFQIRMRCHSQKGTWYVSRDDWGTWERVMMAYLLERKVTLFAIYKELSRNPHAFLR